MAMFVHFLRNPEPGETVVMKTLTGPDHTTLVELVRDEILRSGVLTGKELRLLIKLEVTVMAPCE